LALPRRRSLRSRPCQGTAVRDLVALRASRSRAATPHLHPRTPEPRASLARIALLLTRLNPPCTPLLAPGRSPPLTSHKCFTCTPALLYTCRATSTSTLLLHAASSRCSRSGTGHAAPTLLRRLEPHALRRPSALLARTSGRAHAATACACCSSCARLAAMPARSHRRLFARVLLRPPLGAHAGPSPPVRRAWSLCRPRAWAARPRAPPERLLLGPPRFRCASA
jgi:hypothetical protein